MADARPVPAGVARGLRQDGRRRARARAGRARASRSSRAAGRRGRSARPGSRSRRRGGDRVARDARRPRQDAAPEDPRGDPRRPPATASTSAELAEHGIEPFDLVVVNLYPFRETVASGAGDDEVIEKIDIGGPAMVRAAAKNFASVAVVVDPARYGDVLDRAPPRRRPVARHAPGARGGGVRAHGRVRRRAWRAGSRATPRGRDRRRTLPGVRRARVPASAPTCGTARTRTSAARSTRTPAAAGSSAGRASWSRARRSRSTTGSTSTRRYGLAAMLPGAGATRTRGAPA